MLGLRFCARAFSSWGKRGPLFIAVRGPLTIAASLVAEHKLQTRRLSSCGSRAQLLHSTWDPPRPGLEPVSPALAGRLSTTAPPGKPHPIFLFARSDYHTLKGGTDLLQTTAQQAILKTSNQTSNIWNHDPRAHGGISEGEEIGSRVQGHSHFPFVSSTQHAEVLSCQKLVLGSLQTCLWHCIYLSFCSLC